MSKSLVVLAAAIALSSPAAAQQVEGFASGNTGPFNAGIALQQVPLGSDYELAGEFGVSLRAIWAGLSGAFDLGPAGRIAADSRLSYVFGDGARAGLNLRGTVGPVALEARAAYWTAAPGAEDPLAPYVLRPDPNSGEGYLVSADLAYRLGRNDVLRPAARFSSLGTVLSARYENRTPTLTWSVGGLVALQPAGVTLGAVAGARVVPEDAPYAITLDGLAGLAPDGSFTYGLSGDLSTELSEEGGTLRVYAAYEPWRADVVSGRAGAELVYPVGPGELEIDGRLGFSAAGSAGGGRVAYRFHF